MDLRGFGSVILSMMLHGLDLPGNGGDIHNRAGVTVLMLGGLLQQRQKSRRHEVALRHVCAVDVVPVLERGVFVFEERFLEFFRRLGVSVEGVCGDARVVDKDAQAAFFGGDGVVKFGYVLFGGDVGGYGDDFARDVFAIGFGYAFELFFCSAGDVHFGAVDCEGLHGHEAYAGATAAVETGLAFGVRW